MAYAPKHQPFVVDTVTTANKNIQSFFMRTDQSYHVPEQYRHQQYASRFQPLVLLVDNDRIVVDFAHAKTEAAEDGGRRRSLAGDATVLNEEEEATELTDAISEEAAESEETVEIRAEIPCDGVADCRFNIAKYGSFERCADAVYAAIYDAVSGKVQIGELAVQLVFCDFMPRSELVALVDIVLNKLGFREVMLLPQSLTMSFALGQSHCAFVYPHGLSFIDDFMLFDSYRFRLGGAAAAQDDGCPVDNVDFVEEFSRLRFLDESLRYACDSCELKEASEDRMRQHTEKEHKNDGFYFYTYGSSLSEEFENRLRYLFTTDKAQRVGGCVYFAYSKNQKEIKAFSTRRAAAAPTAVDEQPDGKAQQSVQSLEDPTALAIKGASLFRQLDCLKECWLTDKEWQAFRLRSLKEKVLFFI